MIISKLGYLNTARNLLGEILLQQSGRRVINRLSAYYKSGALKPKPEKMPFGFMAVVCAVLPGLFVGAAISKSVANFLEENELFVVSDDDDDDDDD